MWANLLGFPSWSMAGLPPTPDKDYDDDELHPKLQKEKEATLSSSTEAATHLSSSSQEGAEAPPSYDEVKKMPPKRPPPPGARQVLPESASGETLSFAPPVPTMVALPPPETRTTPSPVVAASPASLPPTSESIVSSQSTPRSGAMVSSTTENGSMANSQSTPGGRTIPQQGTTITIPPGTSMTMSLSPSGQAAVTSQPPPQQIPHNQPLLPPNQGSGPLTYVDFTVGPLRAQMQNLNAWLQKHKEYRVISCETLEIPRENQGVSLGDASNITNVVQFNLRVASNVQYIRVLRVWLTPSVQSSDLPPQQVSFTDVVPLNKKTKKLSFESMPQTIGNFNEKMKKFPLPGRILNIQMLRLKFREKGQPSQERFEENTFTWIREGDDSPEYYYLSYLRVYYIVGLPQPHGAIVQINYEDFIPKQCEDSKSNKDFETFGLPAQRAQNWIMQNVDKKFLNVQTIEHLFVKSPGSKFEAKTSKVLLKDADLGDIRRLKFLRLYYEYYLHVDGSFSPGYNPIYLSYKTFCPVKIQREVKNDPPIYENGLDSWRRATAWLKVTEVKVIGAETVPVTVYPGAKCVYGAHEESFLTGRSDHWREFITYTVRVYINGVYTEPPPNLLPRLPALPEVSDSKDCVILWSSSELTLFFHFPVSNVWLCSWKENPISLMSMQVNWMTDSWQRKLHLLLTVLIYLTLINPEWIHPNPDYNVCNFLFISSWTEISPHLIPLSLQHCFKLLNAPNPSWPHFLCFSISDYVFFRGDNE